MSPPVVTDFLTRHPEASVDLRTELRTSDLVQLGCDLAVSALQPPDATLVRRRLGTVRPIVCGAPLYLQKHPALQAPVDLARHNCLRHPYAPFPDEWHVEDPAGNPVVVPVSGNLITNSVESMRSAAVAGVGLVRTAPFHIADLLASRALTPVLSDYRAQSLDIHAFYPSRKHLSAKVRVFVDLLVDRFREQELCLEPNFG